MNNNNRQKIDTEITPAMYEFKKIITKNAEGMSLNGLSDFRIYSLCKNIRENPADKKSHFAPDFESTFFEFTNEQPTTFQDFPTYTNTHPHCHTCGKRFDYQNTFPYKTFKIQKNLKDEGSVSIVYQTVTFCKQYCYKTSFLRFYHLWIEFLAHLINIIYLEDIHQPQPNSFDLYSENGQPVFYEEIYCESPAITKKSFELIKEAASAFYAVSIEKIAKITTFRELYNEAVHMVDCKTMNIS